jgi:hypothetical protein
MVTSGRATAYRVRSSSDASAYFDVVYVRRDCTSICPREPDGHDAYEALDVRHAVVHDREVTAPDARVPAGEGVTTGARAGEDGSPSPHER